VGARPRYGRSPRKQHFSLAGSVRPLFLVSLEETPARAAARLAPALTDWATSEHYPFPQRLAGLVGPDGQASASSGSELGNDGLLDLASRVAVCGDRWMCASTISRLHQVGVDELMLVAQGTDKLDQLERFVSEVVPLLPTG
jgi:hypothetical protein